jgi:hypothetical protein
MLKEQNAGRHAQLEREVLQLSYKRVLLCRQLDEIDKRMAQFESALAENEAAKRDIQTDEAIRAAQSEEAVVKDAEGEP